MLSVMLWKHRILTTACNYSSYLLEEGRVFSQVFGDHIETEKVTIDAMPCHCQAVHVLVLLCCLLEQLQTFFSLNTQEKDEGNHEKQLYSKIYMLDKINTSRCLPLLLFSLTVSSLIMERTKAQVSMVQDRTVSVRPSRNKRVMEASYVRQNFPLSWRNSMNKKHNKKSCWIFFLQCNKYLLF